MRWVRCLEEDEEGMIKDVKVSPSGFARLHDGKT